MTKRTSSRGTSWFGQQTGLVAAIVILGLSLSLAGGQTSRTVPASESSSGDQSPRGSGGGNTIGVSRNKFLNPENLINGIVKDGSFYAVMAMGATLVIICGGIDLSVGSIFCVSGVLTAMVLHALGPRNGNSVAAGNLSVLLATLLCLGIATIAGLMNGVLTVALRVHPFIITLGTMQLYRCIALVATQAEPYGDFPPAFTSLVRTQMRGLTVVPVFTLIGIVSVTGFVLSRMRFGRHMYAIGGNELASLYSGVRVGAAKIAAYAFAGLCAGIAALLSLGYYGAAQSDWGKGAELKVIAACVVGGTSLLGGRGTAIGSLLGTIIIFMIMNGIDILNINNNYSDGIVGGVIILAVLLDQVGGRRARRAGN